MEEPSFPPRPTSSSPRWRAPSFSRDRLHLTWPSHRPSILICAESPRGADRGPEPRRPGRLEGLSLRWGAQRFSLAFAALTCVFAGATRADDDAVEKIDLFHAGEGGYAHFRIPGIVVTRAGTLLAYCEARRDTRGDWGAIDVMLRRSEDGGATWTPMEKIATPPPDARKNEVATAQKLADAGDITTNNPTMIAEGHEDRREDKPGATDAEQTGAVHFLYCVEYARCFYRRSDDDGRSWGEPLEVTASFEPLRKGFPWRVLATGPGHGLQLRSGRLLVPVWLSTGTGGHAHRPSVNAVIYSDDRGATWQAGDVVSGEFNPLNPSEAAAVELADGSVMLNFRHESPGRGRAISVSPDGVRDWSPVRYDPSLPEPVCMGSLLRLGPRPGSSRDRLLFSNPNNPIDRQRRNLTLKLSYDEGASWPIAKSLEPGPSGYCDLALGKDGAIYCFYERGAASAGPGNPPRLSVAKLSLQWLTEGLDGLTVKERG